MPHQVAAHDQLLMISHLVRLIRKCPQVLDRRTRTLEISLSTETTQPGCLAHNSMHIFHVHSKTCVHYSFSELDDPEKERWQGMRIPLFP